MEVDRFSASLTECYSSHLVCREGCSGCCQHHLSVFPVEAAHIRSAFDELPEEIKTRIQMQAQKVELLESQDDGNIPVACPMLVDGACAIYEARPVICRTQGLPLIYENEEGEQEVDFCPLNFTSPGAVEDLREDALVPLDDLNVQLAALNWRFCQEQGIEADRAGERIPMSRIILDPRS